MSAYFASHREINLLNSEAHRVFRDLVEKMRVAIFMADANGHLFYVNNAFNAMFGFLSNRDAAGKDWDQLLFPDGRLRAAFMEKFKSEGYIVNAEVIHQNFAGQRVFLSLTADFIRSDQGEIIGVRGTIVDISERCRLEEKLRGEDKKLIEILNFCNKLNDVQEISVLNSFIVSQTARVSDSRRCSLMILDGQKEELIVKASYGIAEEFLHNAKVRLGDPVSGLVAVKGQSFLVNDIESHELFRRQRRGSYVSGSFMCAPMFYKERLMGIINVSDKDGHFTATDLQVLEIIAEQAATNISKIQMLNDYEYLAQTDPMTGLLNYRCFIQRLEEEIGRATRYAQPFSLMMIDIDNFKVYNDTYGHPSGDRLLCYLAEMFKNRLRVTDIVCRYGGDEFIIILPNIECSQAVIAGEKLREKFTEDFRQDKLSLSIGVAQFQPGVSKEILVRRVDQALYQAKRLGRNQVVVFQNLQA